MITYSLRPARADDHDALQALQIRASLSNAGDREILLANPDAMELPVEQIAAGHVFLAESGGAFLGLAALLLRDDGDFELDGLFVEPAHWRSGIGRALIAYCRVFALRQGSNSLYVLANPQAEGFYEKCGFETLGLRKTRFGCGLWMSCKLAAETAPED
jgi:N-acetylglutamate synthase-like GNAT family acetyltransferase